MGHTTRAAPSPGSMEINAPQQHGARHDSSSTAPALPRDRTAPGDHGRSTAGTQGCGVSTPLAAAVAATTWGFIGERHIPKGSTHAGPRVGDQREALVPEAQRAVGGHHQG